LKSTCMWHLPSCTSFLDMRRTHMIPCPLAPGQGWEIVEQGCSTSPAQLSLVSLVPANSERDTHEFSPYLPTPATFTHMWGELNAFCARPVGFCNWYVAEVNWNMAITYSIWNAPILYEFLKFQHLRICISIFSALWHSGFSG
jgi:hypothetical protein